MRKKTKPSAPPAELIITDHAYERAKERLSFSATVLTKMAKRAFENGITHAQTKGSLHKFADKVWFTNYSANNIRIYGEVMYLFADNVLVTLYQVPSSLKKLIKVSR